MSADIGWTSPVAIGLSAIELSPTWPPTPLPEPISPAQHANAETQTMGTSVLASQFIAGLQPELKAKVAGKDGGFECSH